MTAPAAVATDPARPLDGVFVFHNRPLRDGMSLHDTARFRDDNWPLAPVTL